MKQAIQELMRLIEKKYPKENYFLVELVLWRDGSGGKIVYRDRNYDENVLLDFGDFDELTKHLGE